MRLPSLRKFPLFMVVLLAFSACGGDETAEDAAVTTTENSTTATTAAQTTTSTTTSTTTTTTQPGPEAVALDAVGSFVGETIKVCGEVFGQVNGLDLVTLNIEDEFNIWILEPDTAVAALERDGLESYYTMDVCVTGETVDPQGDGSYFGIMVEDIEQIELSV